MVAPIPAMTATFAISVMNNTVPMPAIAVCACRGDSSFRYGGRLPRGPE